LDHPNFDYRIPLVNFSIKRGPHPDQRPLDDLAMAEHLVECLFLDVWPSNATVFDFGIESSRHLGALQQAVYVGATAYDLDRVMGNGWAITELVRAACCHPYRDVVFRTVYDESTWDYEESDEF
jgi:hypothetical protein